MMLDLVESRLFGRVCYGYTREKNGLVSVNKDEAKVVKMIFELSMNGYSLEKIQSILFEKQIPSPSGNLKWSRAGIDKILTNEKYLLHGMIDIEKFIETQDDKAERCRYMQSLI